MGLLGLFGSTPFLVGGRYPWWETIRTVYENAAHQNIWRNTKTCRFFIGPYSTMNYKKKSQGHNLIIHKVTLIFGRCVLADANDFANVAVF